MLYFVEKIYYISTKAGGAEMKETAKNKVLSRIYGRGKGWVFSAIDFLPNLKRWEIDRSLTDLEKEEKIVRILPGLYYYPEYSKLLRKNVAPDTGYVAKALARKYDWKIFPDGNTALNYLGLSTQVPAKYIYISNGRSRKYKIGNTTLEFRHRVPKESAITNENANLVIQAVKSIGKIHAKEDNFINALSKRFSLDEWCKIEKMSKKSAYWILNIIKQAKEIANG
jgi:hypothetical protein